MFLAYLFRSFIHFLSEASQSLQDFPHHLYGKAQGVESATKVHLLEVEPNMSVPHASRHVDVLAFEQAWIANVGIGSSQSCLHKRVMVVLVMAKHASIVLANLRDAVVAQECLHVHAEFGVAEPSGTGKKSVSRSTAA